MKLDFKITTWERIDIPLKHLHEKSDLIKKLNSEEITTLNEAIEYYPVHTLEQVVEVDEQMTLEENLGNPTIELIDDTGITVWDNAGTALKNKSEREVVSIKEILSHPDAWKNVEELHPDYGLIEQTQTYFDGEKGYCEYDCIYKRNDGKFFKLEYQDWGRGQDNLGEEDFKEVFPKYKIETYYE
jgi:hypothetical protein